MRLDMLRYVERAPHPVARWEVRKLNIETMMVIISAGSLMVAFAALVLKIIEVARSK